MLVVNDFVKNLVFSVNGIGAESTEQRRWTCVSS